MPNSPPLTDHPAMNGDINSMHPHPGKPINANSYISTDRFIYVWFKDSVGSHQLPVLRARHNDATSNNIAWCGQSVIDYPGNDSYTMDPNCQFANFG